MSQAESLDDAHIWLMVDSGLQRAGVMMAFDEVLLNHAARGAYDRPLLHLYGYSKRAVTVGYSQRIVGSPDVETLVKQGYEVTRRLTGGGLVEHGGDLCYAFVVPSGPLTPRHTHRAWADLLHKGIARACERLGFGLTRVAADGKRHATPSHCFRQPVPGDLLREGVKVAGSAAKRAHGALLHQGSIRVSALAEGRREFFRLFEGLLAELPRAWGDLFGVRFARRSFSMEEVREAYSLARSKYKDKKWIYRC